MRFFIYPKIIFVLGLFPLLSACQTIVQLEGATPVKLPYLKNTANECYYLDEFMPVPDNLVTGLSGALKLRYYSFKFANYKDWNEREIVLSFYSRDDKCWSLFEEFYVVK
ncbi:MAG TPA: hypothetical protein VFO10_15950 [Oligoflexus sp.]|jgi:hypothetical protein|uniref:hypothetical protein n=1 Tax=Oligoflexus sp. TaxID=1971216 RepID=UPI002D80702C|nr:hypothetical protein [Oligoflexus sp.]HET9238754.1 hypothetical protein [Oligoflexus sp.]